MHDNLYASKSDKTRSLKGRLRGRCPACNASVTLRDAAEVWDLVDCPECSARLEVVGLRPPALDYAGNSSNDGDDDWEDDRP